MDTVDTVVGQRIRARRLGLGISQAELGRAIGVRFQQVQKYESGVNRVSASRLWAIADALGVHISHFFEGITPPETGDVDGLAVPKNEFSFLSDHDALEMIQIYANLPAEQKRAVLNFVKSMASNSQLRKLDMPG